MYIDRDLSYVGVCSTHVTNRLKAHSDSDLVVLIGSSPDEGYVTPSPLSLTTVTTAIDQSSSANRDQYTRDQELLLSYQVGQDQGYITL